MPHSALFCAAIDAGFLLIMMVVNKIDRDGVTVQSSTTLDLMMDLGATDEQPGVHHGSTSFLLLC